jgi:hypothetical protein
MCPTRRVRLPLPRLTWFRGAARSARRAHIAEVAGSNPAGTTDELPPWPSGDGNSLTWRGSQVRVLPGVLTAEWTGARFQRGLISRPTPVQIRPPQLDLVRAGQCPAGPHEPGGQVRLLGPRLPGLEVLRPHAALVRRRSGFDSQLDLCIDFGGACTDGARVPRTHPAMGSTPIVSTASRGLWSNGKTPAWRAGDAGSTPAGSTRCPLDTEGSRIRLAGPVC